jgi:hypothetical protein
LRVVEPLLTLPARLARPVLVRACLPLLRAVEEAVEHPVMPSADRDHSVHRRDLGAAFRHRFHVMHLQRSATLSGDPGEEAVTVAFERASAKLAPGLCGIQRRHVFSLLKRVPGGVDAEPIFGCIFTKFLHKISTYIWAVLH